MGVLPDHRVAILVDGIEVERGELVTAGQRRATDLAAADHLLLEVEIRAIPMLEGEADAAHHHIAAAAHPAGTFLIDPHHLVEAAVADGAAFRPLRGIGTAGVQRPRP